MSDGFVDDLQLQDVDPVPIVRESVAFLLDRTPATDLPEELSLDAISRDHADYIDELRARLTTEPL